MVSQGVIKANRMTGVEPDGKAKRAGRKPALHAIALASTLLLGAASTPDPVTIPIAISSKLESHQSGRLIVFVEQATTAGPTNSVDFDKLRPTNTSITAREVNDLSPGHVAQIDGESGAFPGPFSTLPPGRYRFQVVLDRNHDYAYSGRGAGDLTSSVISVSLPGPIPTIILDRVIAAEAEPDEPELLPNVSSIRPIEFISPSLTAFFGRATAIRGWIALPPGYDGKRRFPTIFWNDGFGGSQAGGRTQSLYRVEGMKHGAIPPMIWVQLDQSIATGTHEFADSVNNGPWGHALTAELIPALERKYKMDAKPNGRFVLGHSSGGWAALWLQVRYPKILGGAWATAPDPTDFHDISNVNIYAPDANFFRNAGQPLPISRDKNKIIATTEQYAQSEAVLGDYGGQLASFEWVFSPRGSNGYPMPLFDRSTGKVDPIVAAYWRDHYDIAHVIGRDADRLRSDLSGKIHLFVGTADTYYLDQSALLLQAAMARAHVPASFTFIPGRNHHDLFARGEDRSALFKDMVWQMYLAARPQAKRPT